MTVAHAAVKGDDLTFCGRPTEYTTYLVLLPSHNTPLVDCEACKRTEAFRSLVVEQALVNGCSHPVVSSKPDESGARCPHCLERVA